MHGVSGWEKTTAIATGVAGVGAMLSAIFSWLAARSSGQTSRDARDALAASLKPQIHVNVMQYPPAEAVVARAVVVGPLSPMGVRGVLPATDVRMEFNLASGGQGSTSIAVLEPNGSRWAQEPPYLNLVIAEPNDEWPPPQGDHVTVTVTFSDMRGAASYQQSMSADLHRSAERGLVSFQNVTEPTETRITP